jgi:hypothetical protein
MHEVLKMIENIKLLPVLKCFNACIKIRKSTKIWNRAITVGAHQKRKGMLG